jgi:hypothetical protein
MPQEPPFQGEVSFKMLLAAMLLFFATMSLAQAKEVESWANDLTRIRQFVGVGDCGEAWKLVWSWSRRGNKEALTAAAGLVSFSGLVPDGWSTDETSRLRTILVLFSHGALDDDEYWTEDMREGSGLPKEIVSGILRTYSPLLKGASNMLDCIETDLLWRGCVKRAVEDNLFPSFDEFVTEQSSLNGSDAVDANCSREGALDTQLNRTKD